MTEQKEFVDFNVGLGDTGEDNLAAIQPNTDGEGASQIVFRRPSENLRERTETLRDITGELLYYRDYSHLMIEYTGGTITWNGAAPGAPPLGRLTVTAGSFTVAPMLAPYQAKKGTLSVGTPASNQVIYTVAAASYATHGMNAVTIKHLHSASAVSVTVTISAGPVKRIVVTLNTSDVTHTAVAVQTALAIAIAADTNLAGRLTITTSSVPGVAAIALAETRLDTTADDEKHVIQGSDVQALTTTTPLQPGMGVAVWYKYVIEPAGFGSDPKGGLAGGRAESSGDRGTSTIPAAALFVTNVSPDKIPGAIPLCRVGYNGQLIWYDGTRLEAGESFQFKSPTSVAALALSSFTTTLAGVTGGALVGYNGSGLWADGVTSVTAATMETAVDEVVADLAAFTATSPGAIRIGVDSPTIFSGSPITAIGAGGASTAASGTVRSALDQLDSAVVARRGFTAVCTDGTASTGGDVNSATLFAALNTLAIGSGTYFVRRGTYTNAVIPMTVYGLALIGEYRNLTSLVATANHVFVPTPIIADSSFEFENLYFTATGAATRYILGSSTLRAKNCRAQAGVLEINLHASMSPYAPTRVDIDGLTIDANAAISNSEDALIISNAATSAMPIVGVIRDLRITQVPSVSATPKAALTISQLGGVTDTDVLVFENSHLDPTNYGAPGGQVLYVEGCRQPVTFRNAVFRSSDAVNTVDVAYIDNTSALTYENCIFVQDGKGKVLHVGGTSNDIIFRKCKFYTSPLEANFPEFGVICDEISPSVPAKNIVFEDCYLEIRYGTPVGGTAQRRVEIGSIAGTKTGVGSYTIDGLHIALVYTGFDNTGGGTINNVADYTVSISSGAAGNSRVTANNLVMDLQGKRLVGSGTRIIHLSGDSSADLEVNGLHLFNVTEGNTAAAPTVAVTLENHVVKLDKGRINGGSVNGTPAGSNVAAWKAVIGVTGAGSVAEGIRFYESSAVANKGRLFYLGASCKVLAHTVYDVAFATGESTPGWFAYCDNPRAIIAHNNLYISGGVQNYVMATDNHAFIYMGTAGDRSAISNNTLRMDAGSVKLITLEGARCSLTGNISEVDSATADTSIRLTTTAASNTVTGNTSSNSGAGTATIVDNGTSVNFPNRVFGNTDDVTVGSQIKILSPLAGSYDTRFVPVGVTLSSTAAGAPFMISLDDVLPDGAIITKVRASVDMSAAQGTAANRMGLDIYSIDVLGAVIDTVGPFFAPSNSAAQQYITTGTIALTVSKLAKNFILNVYGSVNTSGDLITGIEVTYTTPKFYVD